MTRAAAFLVPLLVAPLAGQPAGDDLDAYTATMMSRGVSDDGSVMITYSADGPFMPKMLHYSGGAR